MTCPRCSAEVPDDAKDCPACGIIFAKWRAPQPASPDGVPVTATRPASMAPPAWMTPPPLPPPPEVLGITHAGWQAAGIGLVMAILLTWFPFFSFILSPLTTLVHEIGHTVAYWVFGYNAIPAFDFSEGGGVTIADATRSSTIVLGWVFGFLILAWMQREKKPVLIALGVMALLYFLAFNTRGERLSVTLGGHAGEVAFGSLFLYRAFTGWGVKLEAERPLYAFIGFITLMRSLKLGFMLLGNSVDKAWYLQGKRGMDNDLVMGALYLGWTLEGTARALILFTLLSIPATAWAASLRKHIGAVSEAEEEV